MNTQIKEINSFTMEAKVTVDWDELEEKEVE